MVSPRSSALGPGRNALLLVEERNGGPRVFSSDSTQIGRAGVEGIGNS